MTDQQLRALGRKHLLMMIRDLEKSLEQVMAEREALMQAFRYGYAQGCGFQDQQNVVIGQPGWQLPAAEQAPIVQEAQEVWYPQPVYAQQQAAWQMYPGPLAH